MLHQHQLLFQKLTIALYLRYSVLVVTTIPTYVPTINIHSFTWLVALATKSHFNDSESSELGPVNVWLLTYDSGTRNYNNAHVNHANHLQVLLNLLLKKRKKKVCLTCCMLHGRVKLVWNYLCEIQNSSKHRILQFQSSKIPFLPIIQTIRSNEWQYLNEEGTHVSKLKGRNESSWLIRSPHQY